MGATAPIQWPPPWNGVGAYACQSKGILRRVWHAASIIT